MKILIASQENKIDLDLEDLINFPLTSVPFSLGTADGFLAKTDKSKGMHYLTNETELQHFPNPEETYFIEEIPNNFEKNSIKIFEIMQKKSDFCFSTDSYNLFSIKTLE